jgi:cell division protease FtsH
MNQLAKTIGLVLAILLVSSAIFSFFVPEQDPEIREISFNQLVQDISEEKVTKIIATEDSLQIIYQDESQANSKKEPGVSLTQSLINYGLEAENLKSVDLEFEEAPVEFATAFLPILLIMLPALMILGFFWFAFRKTKGSLNQTMSFLKSPDQKFVAQKKKSKISFSDVGGLEEVKNELEEIVEFLKKPEKFLSMGAKIPRGVLLIGAPGSGKTLLARAIASEASVPFYSISGSEFVEMFVGVGSRRVKDLFEKAKKTQPSIVFVDELDAIGRTRGLGWGGGNDEREQTLNQILVEMDGFRREEKVIVLAATNRPDVLDPALLRPGRFDRRIVTDLPDIKNRVEILKIHCRNKPLAKDVSLQEISERTSGFSGADLENLANEAAILAARRNKKSIAQEDFLESIMKVMLGPERKSHLLDDQEKEVAAYHEAGHALVSSLIPGSEIIRKVSIVARGLSAGYTFSTPAKEKRLVNQDQLKGTLAAMLGGYSAEKIKYGQVSTGASNDLQRASSLARKMVSEYGMSDLGPISFHEETEWWQTGMPQRTFSEEWATKADQEISRIIKEAEAEAIKMLKKNQPTLNKLVKALIKKETLEREEFEEIVKAGSQKTKSSNS